MNQENIHIYRNGEIIFKEGDPGESMYILLQGAVELRIKVNGAESVIKVIEAPNDFFGEMALIDGKPRSATAIAVKNTRLLEVNREAFENMIVTNGKFALKIIKILSERIRQTNEQIENLLNTNPRDRINRGIVDYALQVNERIHDGSYKVRVLDLKNWLNTKLGITLDDIDNQLFRLLKAQNISYAPTSAQSKECIIVPTTFIKEYNRRSSQVSR
ncbi:MAG: cyclic nucleotide-binding domain-containing protein [Treponemataceae bacterium]|nr:cyclic nucleotide-binding domain-containing protein [Treponemataceae bacterium]